MVNSIIQSLRATRVENRIETIQRYQNAEKTIQINTMNICNSKGYTKNKVKCYEAYDIYKVYQLYFLTVLNLISLIFGCEISS
jgi:hypothetical protein